MKKKFGILWVALFVFIDQLTKYVAKANLEGTKGVDVIKGVFRFEYLENRGIAFGMFQNKFFLFVLITLVILAVLAYVYYKLPDTAHYRPLQFCMILIAAGAIGNMIDRIVNNYVIDFLYFNLIDFPIFNIADCYVTVTVIVLFILIMFYYKEEDLDFMKKGKDTQ